MPVSLDVQLRPASDGGLILDRVARSAAAARALVQEHALLQQLPADLFPTPLGLRVQPASTRLRCRIPYATRLDEVLASAPPPTPLAGLRLCLSLARTVAALHAQGLADRQLSPLRFYAPADDDTGRVCLAQLAHLSRPSVEERAVGAVAWLEGDLNYLAPEQSGRMNCSIDHRADLYTLGVMFYRILVGRLPFTAADDLALVHAHLSLPPPWPSSFIDGFEPAWEAVLHKLLAKNAEDRYQTAEGLASDLKQLVAHAAAATRPPGFVPGADDHCSDLRIPARLYGRGAARQSVLESFATTVAGGKVLLLVAGASGVGKSSLINEVHKPITAARGIFAAAKFDQFQRDQPYVAVLGALRELVRTLLAEPESVIAQWREQLAAALEGAGRVLTDLLPEMKRLIGEQPPLAEVGPSAAAARMKRVFQNFIRVLARPGQPLVLFLDDLQWADAASLQLIETLFADTQAGHLMVLGAYRDNEITPGHLLPASLAHIAEAGGAVETITIEPLTVASVAQLLADTLRRSADDVQALAELLHEKTAGNPFHLKVLLQTLSERGLLAYRRERQRWEWDEDAIGAVGIAGNVVDLVLGTLRELPASAALTLSQAAFLGASFLAADLRAIGEGNPGIDAASPDVERLQLDLELLEQRRYLLRRHGSHDELYHFQHDRIQEAAYQWCSGEERRARHVHIGQRLAEREPQLEESDRLFMILQHLNQGLGSGPVPRRLLALNVIAGQRAKRSLAYASAARSLRLVHERLDDALWAEQRDFAFGATFELAQTLFLDGQVEPSLEVAASLVSRTATPLERAAVQNHLLTLHSFQGRYAQALAAGRQALAALGLDFPTEGLAGSCDALMVSVQQRLLALTPERLVDHFLMSSPEVALAMRVLKGLAAASFGFDDLLFRAATSLSVDLTLRHGLADESAYLLTCYGMLAWRRAGDEAFAVQLGHTGLAVAERFNNKQSICQACEVLVGHLNHWGRPLAESRELNRRANEAGIEAGEPQFVSYTAMYHGFNLFHLGQPLAQLVELTSGWREFSQACGNSLAVDGLEAIQLIAGLLGAATPLGEPDVLDGLEPQRLALWRSHSSTVPVLYYLVARAQVHLLMGEVREARPLVAHVRSQKPTVSMSGMVSVAVHRYLEMQVAARLAGDSEAGRAEAIGEVRACLVDLQRWADAAPSNFRHYPLAARAELALLQRRPDEALAGLEAALAAAQGAMALDTISLAERAADLCYRLGATARAAGLLTQALQAASALGAERKVHHLIARHPLLAALREAAPVRRSLGELELDRVLGIIAAFSREIGLEALVAQVARTLLELSGGSGFALLLAGENGEWRLRARMGLAGGLGQAEGGPGRLSFEDLPFDGDEALLPRRPVRLVLNSGETLVCDRPADVPQYADDRYLQAKRPGAIVCLPVAVGAEPVGLIYLESALASGVFTPKALRWVEILSGQIGISLLNATLYERMEQKVAQRTAALSGANQSLEALAQTLRTLGDVGQEITSQLARDSVVLTLERHASLLLDGAVLSVFCHDEASDAEALRAVGRQVPSPAIAALALSTAAQRLEAGDATGRRMTVPLLAGERLVGVMGLERDGGGAFNPRQQLIVRSLASYGAIALDNAAAYDHLDRTLKRLHDTQTQLVVTEKLAALGQLTAGVAHEIQNPLNFVNNFAEVSKGLVDELRDQFQRAPLATSERDNAFEVCAMVRQNLDIILANGKRTAAIVRGMLRHSHHHGGEAEPTDLNALLKRRVLLLERTLPITRLALLVRRVQFDWQLDPGLPPVMIVAPDVAGVLDNLLHNALSALETRLGTSGLAQPPTITLGSRRDRGAVVLLLRDNGIGIAYEDQPKLFTPFFTTRTPGEGSGLGLSLAFDIIVKRHRGSLQIESVPGQFTEVRLTLPQDAPEALAGVVRADREWAAESLKP